MSESFTTEELAAIKARADELQAKIKPAPVLDEKAMMEKIKAELKAQLEEEAKAKADSEAQEAKRLADEQARAAQSEELAALQKRVSEMSEKRGVANTTNPFKGDTQNLDQALNDPAFVQSVDDASRKLWMSERHKQ